MASSPLARTQRFGSKIASLCVWGVSDVSDRRSLCFVSASSSMDVYTSLSLSTAHSQDAGDSFRCVLLLPLWLCVPHDWKPGFWRRRPPGLGHHCKFIDSATSSFLNLTEPNRSPAPQRLSMPTNHAVQKSSPLLTLFLIQSINPFSSSSSVRAHPPGAELHHLPSSFQAHRQQAHGDL